MGELLDQIKKPPAEYTPAKSKRPIHPSREWEPRVDTDKGIIVARKPKDKVDLHDIENAVDWSDHLAAWGFDAQHFTVEEPVEIRTWDAIPESGRVETFIYFKARIRRKRKREDLSALIAEIKRHKPVKIVTNTGPVWLVVGLADWQLGKRDQGGSEGIVRRVLELNDTVIQRVKELRRTVELGGIAVVGMGDIVEGCKGFYPNQPNQIDLDRREQTTVARRLILSLIRNWSKLTPQMVVAAVPGNHGENRNADGSYNTLPDRDNDDIAVFEQVAEILAENPDRYGHVRFVIPNGEDSITLDMDGTIVAFTHGHHAGRGGPGVMAKLWTWWTKQTHAMQPIGDATILISAHFHHLILQQQGPKTHIQCPALEGGSDWYAKRQGYQTHPGTLTFTVDAGGWDHLRVL